jgi:hypothetical protein
MFRKAVAASLAAIVIGMIATNSSRAGPVDLFEDGPFQLQASDTPDSISQSGLDPARVIGGRRDVTLTNVGLAAPAQATAQLDDTAGDDALIAQTQNNGAIRLQLDYGLGNALNADLSASDSVSMFFDQLPLFAGFEATIDSGAGSGTVSLNTQTDTITNDVRFRFDAPGFSNVDFADVDAMHFRVITDYGDGFALAQITTSSSAPTAIPLPAAVFPGVTTLVALLLGNHLRRREFVG